MIMMRGEGIFSFSFLLVAQIFKTKYVLIDIVRLFRYNKNVYIEDIENIYRDENCRTVLSIGMVELSTMSFFIGDSNAEIHDY
mgnify:CR=1 FL=1